MIIDDTSEHIEPELRQLGQYFTLMRDQRWQNAIKCRNSIRRDEEQTFFIYLIYVAHFAAMNK